MANSALTVIGIDKGINMYKGVVTWANLTIPKLTEEAADWGKTMAVDKAPKQTHALVQAIKVEAGRSKSDWRILSRTPKNPNTTRRVPYQKYLHLGLHGRYMKVSKHGDHQYMFTVGRMLADKYPKSVKKSLDKIKHTV